MTNHWIDLRNSDAILAIGCNPAENHPISMKWIEAAMDGGGKLITVDPRFTRTASKADLYAQIRPGTDIAFLGGMINYALQKDLIHHEYVREYTNASFIINEKYEFENGLFCGFDDQEKTYDLKSWAYETDAAGNPKTDKSLTHPRSVYQLMKKHFSRYDVEMVCSITGTRMEDFLAVARTFCATGRPDRAGTVLYAMGITQSTHGTQNVRAISMLQTLLGNIGIAGGGINALRGESNVQGSTDYGLLFHILPGYLKSPEYNNTDLKAYLEKWTPKTNDKKSANWWGNTPKYTVSLLKAWYGEHATRENDFCFSYLPKRSGNYSYLKLLERMAKGEMEGLVCMGMNPAMGGPDSTTARDALGKLKWLVTVDLWETETSIFWKRPGVNPRDIQTEVFMLPAASSVEKEGSISNSGRWTQWRYKAVEPVGEARSDLAIIDQFYKRVAALYRKEKGAFPEPITSLAWNYGNGHEPDVQLVAREINGYFTRDMTITDKDKVLEFKKGDQVPMFKYLQDDGSTVSGCWIYCGSFTKEGNQMARRDAGDPTGLGLFPKWSWCWPVNRRIIYNRASVNPAGEPFNPKRPVVAWDPLEKKWKGDVPDGPWPPMKDDKEGKYPFIMVPEGHARLYALDMKDGPFPEHYEPVESPAKNLLSGVQNNPAVKIPKNVSSDLARFPYIGTTYRVTEHWQAGAMTRNLPWLVELVPDMFVELSETLAKQKGIKQGDKVSITTERGNIQATALVTARLKPFKVGGKMIEQVGMPWHFGYAGIAKGDSGNVLTPSVGCANTNIPEFKAFLCNIEKGGKSA
ncbi:MAG: formate dehydrogenase alpha [Geobacteraceae bacterium]|nr:MAG: formate dehydrogenase alpha [Geobacteraceae bacterium]